MNPSDFDHPDLTAYALGELGEPDAARVRQMLARSPEARLEFERIQHAVSALKQPGALPRRSLTPRQRETVLTMAQTPVRAANVVPFKQTPAKAPSMLWRVSKLAAAACLTAGAFFIGQKSAQRLPAVASTQGPAPAGDPAKSPAGTTVASVPVRPVPNVTADLSLADFEVVIQELPKVPSLSSRPLVESRPPVAPIKGPLVAKSEPVAHAPAPALPAVKPASLAGFTTTASAPEAVMAFHPGLVRPVPVEFAGIVLASKAPVDPKSANPSGARNKADNPPALIVHSWKAELATCPWDSGRRLMRFVAQIPVDQDAMDAGDAEYRLVAKFDPAQVQAYRLVTEKHMPPSTGGTQATRFAWYEIVPAKNFHASHDKPVVLGTVEIVQPRGASNRDATSLKLLDRGQNWTEAREDFVFETAMVGFNQLLQGTINTSGLDHKVVLDLAEKTKGEDASGERAKFIQTVKQAQRAAGL